MQIFLRLHFPTGGFTGNLVQITDPQLRQALGSDDFTDQMEQNGTITMVASDGETLVVTGIS